MQSAAEFPVYPMPPLASPVTTRAQREFYFRKVHRPTLLALLTGQPARALGWILIAVGVVLATASAIRVLRK